MSLQDVEFVDRYGPKGPPSLLVGCRGPCEAMGIVPVYGDVSESRSGRAVIEPERDSILRKLWSEAEAKEPSEDGWHFVTCPDCGGTGRSRGWKRVTAVGFWLGRKIHFARHHVFVWPYTARNPRTFAERLDVPRPWLWNRRVALRVLFGIR